MLTNLVRDLDDHDLSVLHTRNTQNGLVGVACVNPIQKKIAARTEPADTPLHSSEVRMLPRGHGLTYLVQLE